MRLNKNSIRIVEIILYRSKKHPRLGHAVATLFPCNHKRNLGIARMNGTDHHRRVSDVQVWIPFSFSVSEQVYCKNCPDVFEPDVPVTLSQIADTENGLDIDDEI
jgi:hypothetical protein